MKTIQSVMNADIAEFSIYDSLSTAALEFRAEEATVGVVKHNGEIVGVFNENDLANALYKLKPAKSVNLIMHKDYFSVHPETTINEAKNALEANPDKKRSFFVVFEEDAIIGVFSARDLKLAPSNYMYYYQMAQDVILVLFAVITLYAFVTMGPLNFLL